MRDRVPASLVLVEKQPTLATGLDGKLTESLANGQVGTGFATQYRIQPVGRCKATTSSSLPLTTNSFQKLCPRQIVEVCA